MLGRGCTAGMGMGMWLKRHRYAAGGKKKKKKPFKEIFSRPLGNLLKAVPEAPSVGVF